MRVFVAIAALAIAALAISAPAFAQSTQPGWITDAHNGCKVWDPVPDPAETIIWSGDCRNGLAEGQGVLQWFDNGKPNGRDQGRWAKGMMNGQGKSILPNGSHYDGEWRDGEANGIGTAVINGKTYTGTWTNGCYYMRGGAGAWWNVDPSQCQ